jgi:hypothetical protein
MKIALISILAIVLHAVAMADTKTAITGSGVEISVTADGTQPFTYQWRKNGVAINGATGAKLVLTNLTPANTGRYAAEVSNAAGSTISDDAVLTVNDPIYPPTAAKTTTVVITVTARTDAAGKVVIDVKAKPAP